MAWNAKRLIRKVIYDEMSSSWLPADRAGQILDCWFLSVGGYGPSSLRPMMLYRAGRQS